MAVNSLNLVLNAIVSSEVTKDLNTSILNLANNPALSKLKLKVEIDMTSIDTLITKIKEIQDMLAKVEASAKKFNSGGPNTGGNKSGGAASGGNSKPSATPAPAPAPAPAPPAINRTQLFNDEREFNRVIENAKREAYELGDVLSVRLGGHILDPITTELKQFTLLVDKANGDIQSMVYSWKDPIEEEGVVIQEGGFDRTRLSEKNPSEALTLQNRAYKEMNDSLDKAQKIKLEMLTADKLDNALLQTRLNDEQDRYVLLEKEEALSKILNKDQIAMLAQKKSAYEQSFNDADRKTGRKNYDENEKQWLADSNAGYARQEDIISKIYSWKEKLAKVDQLDTDTGDKYKAIIARQEERLKSTQSRMKTNKITSKDGDIAMIEIEYEAYKKLDVLQTSIREKNDRKPAAENTAQGKIYKDREDTLKRISELELKIAVSKSKDMGGTAAEQQVVLDREILLLSTQIEETRQKTLSSATKENELAKTEMKNTQLLIDKEKELNAAKADSIRLKQLEVDNRYGPESSDAKFIGIGSDKKTLDDYVKQVAGTREVLDKNVKVGLDSAKQAITTYTIKVRDGTDSFKQYTLVARDVAKTLHTVNVETGKVPSKEMGIGGMLEQALKKYPIWMIATTIFQQAIQGVKDGIQYVVKMDEALTSLAKVTDLTTKQFDNMRDSSIAMGKELGKSSIDIMKSYAEIARVYKNPDDIKELARVNAYAPSYSNV